jgi:hypothetical protein
MTARLIDEVLDALDEQTVVVPGTGTLDTVVPSNAGHWKPRSKPPWRTSASVMS